MAKQLSLFLNIDRPEYSRDWVEVTAKVGYYDSEKDSFEGFHHTFDDKPDRYFEGLTVRCFVGKSLAHAHPHCYGWDWYEYSTSDLPYSLPCSKIKMMDKTVQSLNRKMDKIIKNEGTAKTFSQLVNQFARSVGAKGLVRSGNHGFVFSSIGSDLISSIDFCISDLLSELGESQ